MKKMLSGALRTQGWVAFPEWRLARWPAEQHLSRVFAAYDIDCVLDVGANTGQFRDLLRNEVGYRGPIQSFEPVSAHVSTLRARAASDPSWRIWPWALGRESQKKSINLYSSPGLSSLLPPDLDAMHKLLPRPDTTLTGTEEVTVRRLDEVFAEVTAGLTFNNVFLKLDTQGYDLDVIEGAGSVLEKVAALQTELSVLPIYQTIPDYRVALQTLTERGYAISGIFPVTHDPALRIIEMDCVMVRNIQSVTRGR
jgi:FkbM family methyltransferase